MRISFSAASDEGPVPGCRCRCAVGGRAGEGRQETDLLRYRVSDFAGISFCLYRLTRGTASVLPPPPGHHIGEPGLHQTQQGRDQDI